MQSWLPATAPGQHTLAALPVAHMHQQWCPWEGPLAAAGLPGLALATAVPCGGYGRHQGQSLAGFADLPTATMRTSMLDAPSKGNVQNWEAGLHGITATTK